ncbi:MULTISPECIES: hypothetical protein [Streptomyces]|uniref:DUF2283 domain-containing protein n=1 Tax=Streptomyces ramulosus TaxID=47762 RepID=A0ABW1FLP9_9ACTN
MRIKALYEPDGTIIAMAELRDGAEVRPELLPSPSSAHPGEQRVAELEIPDEFRERPLAEVAAGFRVEPAPEGVRLARK